ncbi:MAG: hypothetical protein ACR2KT_08330 [Methylocella sp.]
MAHHTIYYQREDTNPSLRPVRLDMRLNSQKYLPLDIQKIFDFSSSIGTVFKDLKVLIAAMEIVQRDTLQQKSSEQGSGKSSP